MRFLPAAFLTALLVGSVPALANNVAVADSQAAVLNSDLAKSTVASLNSSLAPQRTRLEALTKDIQGIQQRYQKDGAVMSDTDKKALQAQAQTKLNEYNSTAEGMQKRLEDAQSNMLKTLMPRLEKIIEDLRKEGNYDVIIEKRNVIWAGDSVDLTKKITERLNQSK